MTVVRGSPPPSPHRGMVVIFNKRCGATACAHFDAVVTPPTTAGFLHRLRVCARSGSLRQTGRRLVPTQVGTRRAPQAPTHTTTPNVFCILAANDFDCIFLIHHKDMR